MRRGEEGEEKEKREGERKREIYFNIQNVEPSCMRMVRGIKERIGSWLSTNLIIWYQKEHAGSKRRAGEINVIL